MIVWPALANAVGENNVAMSCVAHVVIVWLGLHLFGCLFRLFDDLEEQDSDDLSGMN